MLSKEFIYIKKVALCLTVISITLIPSKSQNMDCPSILNKMPVWEPALQKNKPVLQEIRFKLIFGKNKYWTKKYE